MNILNYLRKPYTSFFLTFIILLVSCSKYEDNTNLEEALSLTEYAEKHISLTTQLVNYIDSDREAIISVLGTLNDKTSFNELEQILINTSIKDANNIAELMTEIQENTFQFIDSNPEIKNMQQDEIIRIISDELILQNNDLNINSRSNSCQSAYEAAGDVCEDNYIFSLAVVGVSAFFTFGIGTAIGTVGATIALANCLDNAFHTFIDCQYH